MSLPPQQPEQQISEQEYLDGELISEVKHEFIDGSVYAMAGASADHGRIAGNLLAAFLRHLQERKSPCEPFLADMKVKKEVLLPGCACLLRAGGERVLPQCSFAHR